MVLTAGKGISSIFINSYFTTLIITLLAKFNSNCLPLLVHYSSKINLLTLVNFNFNFTSIKNSIIGKDKLYLIYR